MIGKQKPVVLFVRQNLEALIEVRYTGIKKWAGKRFTKFVYAFAAVFRRHAMLVTVGEEMFQVLAPDFNSSRYISDAIVPKAFALPARKKRTPGVLKLLFVGRLEPEKGLPDLIHALKLINEKDQAQLTIIGEGISKIEAETLVRELEIGHKVDFKGYVAFGEQLFDAYASHDILMISSYSEGLPKIINESRAFAIPIVSTKVGGIANELKDGETCLFVNPGMPDQLAEAALRLSADMDLYALISKNLSLEFQKNSLEFWSEEFFQFVKNHFN
ncbi:MAG: glycosyltransferase family 4 protein [Algoriphagus aquaeductus]|uniref:glycosyltransferase family 4 protein n=1 Tax=Algoriphagus aquaeductus TaxID=475299 RepID=UPI00391CBDC4